jgi:hypothetical protein
MSSKLTVLDVIKANKAGAKPTFEAKPLQGAEAVADIALITCQSFHQFEMSHGSPPMGAVMFHHQ